MRRRDDVDALAEHLFRISEFHRWVQSNVLFPMVPDAIVHPLLEQLRQAEHRLVALLYDHHEFDRVAQIHKALTAEVKPLVKP